MKHSKPVWFLTVFALCAIVRADEAQIVSEEFLKDWQRAAKKVQSIDVKFVRLAADGSFQKETQDRGRVYWQASAGVSYQVGHTYHMIWDDGVLYVEPNRREFFKRSNIERNVALARQAELDNMSFFQKYFHLGEVIESLLTCRTLDDLLPLCFAIDVEAVQSRYRLTITQDDRGLFLTAVPKNTSDPNPICQIDLLLDRQTFSVKAHRIVRKQGDYLVHLFEAGAVNEVPADREQLLHPDLHEYTETLRREPVEAE